MKEKAKECKIEKSEEKSIEEIQSKRQQINPTAIPNYGLGSISGEKARSNQRENN